MSLGAKIRDLREEKGLRQEDIGKMFNISKSAVSQWENDIRTPDTEFIVKLANYFGVTTDYLLGSNQYPDVNVSYELHEGANIRSITDVDHVLNEVRKELTQYINEGRISEEKAVHAVDLLRQQLMLLLEQK